MMGWMFKEFNRSSRGFTLIEWVVSMGISSLVISGLVTSVHQLILVPTEVEADLTVMQQAQNLSYWISRDGQMIQTINMGDDPDTAENEAFTFSWVCEKRTDIYDNECIDAFLVRYLYDDGRLSRYEQLSTDTYNPNGDLISSTDIQKTTAIAEHVSSIEGVLNNGGLTVSATLSYGDAQLQRTYDITPRVNILN